MPACAAEVKPAPAAPAAKPEEEPKEEPYVPGERSTQQQVGHRNSCVISSDNLVRSFYMA